jgi:DnaA family protein
MQQLLLDIRPPASPTLDRFVVGRNHELVAQLHALLDDSASERTLYVWGAPGSGKSYLLQAYANACRARGLSVGGPGDQADHLIADQADDWSPAQQLDAFAAYNRVRERGGVWLAAGRQPPNQLMLMPDLQTRLGWGLVFHLAHLDDAEKRAALTQHARGLGFVLEPPIADYLLRHYARDMDSLLRIVEALDRASLETRRPITLALLRQLAPTTGD